MIPAVILAAGASTRMGSPKALLMGASGVPFVLQIARTLLDGGASDVIVVSRAELAGEIDRALESLNPAATVVVNPHPDRGQASSLQCALAVVDRPGVQALLVTPVDLPGITSATVAAVIAAYRSARPAVVRPIRSGRHGHPLLLDRRVFDDVQHLAHDQGLRAVVWAHAADSVSVPVDDDGVLFDVDTPAEYRRWRDGL